ncbi:PorT family protein [Pedobacter sp. HDW13]|uniref:porin family protein n=1 Tax=unclassified Pedobacter TaxID=2628915 RepID=UPI000F5A80E2|nr:MULTISPECIES: porin family protein [unclassified Pedobacter]QIL40921.1 PorT family protein [Pedobacter sp. HDW13]RQO71266.1 PorT family protein [Pedobacter sp. KBW01]
MKKIILSLLTVAALSTVALAQTNNSTKIGVKAGVTFPTFGTSGTENEDDNWKINTSFYVGGTVDFQISERFSIQPGLSLIGKGGKGDYYEHNGEPNNLIAFRGTAKLSMLYLELPVNAIVNFETGNGKIFIGAGPYYATAISGKTKTTGILTAGTSSLTTSTNEDIKFGKDGTMKRGEFGVNFLAGYQLSNGFNIHAGYGLGLSNLDYSDTRVSKVTNRVLSVGLGFSF